MDDDTDAKEALFLILGEYSSDYILKAYQYEAKRLCKFYNQGKFIEVIQIDIYCSTIAFRKSIEYSYY